jgi:hypothetical protein
MVPPPMPIGHNRSQTQSEVVIDGFASHIFRECEIAFEIACGVHAFGFFVRACQWRTYAVKPHACTCVCVSVPCAGFCAGFCARVCALCVRELQWVRPSTPVPM